MRNNRSHPNSFKWTIYSTLVASTSLASVDALTSKNLFFIEVSKLELDMKQQGDEATSHKISKKKVTFFTEMARPLSSVFSPTSLCSKPPQITQSTSKWLHRSLEKNVLKNNELNATSAITQRFRFPISEPAEQNSPHALFFRHGITTTDYSIKKRKQRAQMADDGCSYFQRLNSAGKCLAKIFMLEYRCMQKSGSVFGF